MLIVAKIAQMCFFSSITVNFFTNSTKNHCVACKFGQLLQLIIVAALLQWHKLLYIFLVTPKKKFGQNDYTFDMKKNT